MVTWNKIFDVKYIQDGWNTWINQADYQTTYKYRYIRLI